MGAPVTALPLIVDATALAAFVDERVRLALEHQAAPPSCTTYSSPSPPPGMSRDRFNEVCPKVPGARRSGRSWVIDRDAFHRWCDEQAKRRRAPRPPIKSGSPELREMAREIIAAANLRGTKPAA